jgi:hypothetical protein
MIAFGFGSFIGRGRVVEVVDKVPRTSLSEQLDPHPWILHGPLRHDLGTRADKGLWDVYRTIVPCLKIKRKRHGLTLLPATCPNF